MVTDNLVLFPDPSSQDVGDLWQVATFLMPAWMEEGKGPYRPISALAVSRDRGLIGTSKEMADSEPAFRLAEQALAALEEAVGGRPAVIEVTDATLAEQLRGHQRWRDCEVRVCDELEAHRSVYRALRDDLTADDPRAPLIAGEGVTIDRVRRFAEAAVRFFNAAPWRLFSNGDHIRLEPPPTAPDLGACVVMGSGDEEHGILLAQTHAAFSFAEVDAEQPTLTEALWSVSFDEPYELALADHDLWLENGLPTAPDGRIPSPKAFRPDPALIERPTADCLAVFEGVLDAFAMVGEEEADSGRWHASVDTASGRLELDFELPAIDDDLLASLGVEADEDDEDDLGDDGPLVRPSEDVDLLVDLSLETDGRLAARLAARALELEPDFAPAHFAAGLAAVDPERRIAGIRRSVRSMENVIGKRDLKRHRGGLTEIEGGRSLLLFRRHLAVELARAGRFDEAVDEDREMLALDQPDHFGARHLLAAHLMAAGREGEARDWLADPARREPSAVWHYHRALADFRLDPAGVAASRARAEAIEFNPTVTGILAGLLPWPSEEPEMYQPGDPDEAAVYVVAFAWLWEATPGAREWLEEGFARHAMKRVRARSRAKGSGRPKRHR